MRGPRVRVEGPIVKVRVLRVRARGPKERMKGPRVRMRGSCVKASVLRVRGRDLKVRVECPIEGEIRK